jgi:molybdopterin-guanine dinucleotide biosynthesis protein
MREAILDTKGTTLHKSVQIVAHVDIVVIEGKYKNSVRDAFYRLEMEAQKMGSVINYDKANICGEW